MRTDRTFGDNCFFFSSFRHSNCGRFKLTINSKFIKPRSMLMLIWQLCLLQMLCTNLILSWDFSTPLNLPFHATFSYWNFPVCLMEHWTGGGPVGFGCLALFTFHCTAAFTCYENIYFKIICFSLVTVWSLTFFSTNCSVNSVKCNVV